MKTIVIDDEHRRERLDTYLCGLLPDLSRAYVQRLISTGEISLNDSTVKSGYRLQPGDKVEILVDLDRTQKIEDIDLPIVYEDKNIVVINKPVGIISHSRGKFWYEPSVASFMRQISGEEGERSGIVHRLDRATSGVMICSKNVETMKFLQKQFADRSVEKTYIAVVTGSLKNDTAIIDMPIERNPKQPQIFRVGSQGKASVTRYKVIESNSKYSMLELKPQTGRTHQLRVHLEHLGHPIVGDELYGGEQHERLLLHAKTLSILLPSGDKKVFEAPLPEEFKSIMDKVD